MASLTILMPVYNAAPFLREALDSLLEQTFTDFEFWLIDDGSTDASRAVMQLYNDARIRLFLFDTNRGRVAVVNEVVAKVTTPFFSITDADDVSHPQRLQKQMDVLLKDETLMMCGTAYVAMNEAGKVFRKVHLPRQHEAIYEQMPRHSQFHGPTTIMRSTLLKAYTPLYRQYFKDNIADADLASRIVDTYRTANVAEPLYAYRIVHNSLSRKNTSIRFLNLYQIVSCLSQERRRDGIDSLMRNDTTYLNQFVAKINEQYNMDTSLVHRHIAFRHLYWGLIPNAWKSVKSAFIANPFHRKNYLLFGYVLVKGAIYFLFGWALGRHYSFYMRVKIDTSKST